MKINVYLPDEIGRKAKMWKINFSLTLRNAVIKELKKRTAESVSRITLACVRADKINCSNYKKPNMKQIKFSIIGTSPLIQHRWPNKGEIPGRTCGTSSNPTVKLNRNLSQ